MRHLAERCLYRVLGAKTQPWFPHISSPKPQFVRVGRGGDGVDWLSLLRVRINPYFSHVRSYTSPMLVGESER